MKYCECKSGLIIANLEKAEGECPLCKLPKKLNKRLKTMSEAYNDANERIGGGIKPYLFSTFDIIRGGVMVSLLFLMGFLFTYGTDFNLYFSILGGVFWMVSVALIVITIRGWDIRRGSKK